MWFKNTKILFKLKPINEWQFFSEQLLFRKLFGQNWTSATYSHDTINIPDMSYVQITQR